MTLKIKYKLHNESCKLNIIDKGEWIDLTTAQRTIFGAPYIQDNKVLFEYKLISLGVSIKLPKGYEAMVLPRSSTFKNFGILASSSEGVIDSSYSGTNDIWKFPALSLRKMVIPEGTRIAQFRIQLSQKASLITKLKWLFTNKIEFIPVDKLDEVDRGGFGSTNLSDECGNV